MEYFGSKDGRKWFEGNGFGEFASCCGVNLAGAAAGAGVKPVSCGDPDRHELSHDLMRNAVQDSRLRPSAKIGRTWGTQDGAIQKAQG